MQMNPASLWVYKAHIFSVEQSNESHILEETRVLCISIWHSVKCSFWIFLLYWILNPYQVGRYIKELTFFSFCFSLAPFFFNYFFSFSLYPFFLLSTSLSHALPTPAFSYPLEPKASHRVSCRPAHVPVCCGVPPSLLMLVSLVEEE